LQRFTASDGVELHYEEAGNGRPLLLLHGLMAHAGFWHGQWPLADDFRLISPDLRGHGRSKADPATVTVDRLVADMAELVEQLDLRDAIAVGWSLGAAIAWPLLAGPVGGRFAGSVVVDMTPRIRNDGEWQLGLEPEIVAARAAAFRGDFASFAAAAGPAVLAPPLEDGKAELAAWAAAEFARNDPAAMGALWASLAEQDNRPLLPGIAQPTLIVRGAHSYLYGPETARYLAGALPHACIVEFGSSGHAPALEEPEHFNSTIRSFIAELAPAREATTTA
jgi:pimeloyl-ACP methyl ester carboxylesterase